MVLFHQMNSKDFNCIQSEKLTEIGSHVVLLHQMNSKGFNCIESENTYRNLITFGDCSSSEF